MPRDAPVLKAWYTVPELARIAGTHRKDMRLELDRYKVPIRYRARNGQRGRTGRVYISQIERLAPELLAAIVRVVRIRAAMGSEAA